MKLNNKKIKADNIVLNELERLSKIENNDLFASELDKFIEKSKRNDYSFIDGDGVVWKSLDDEGLPNVFVGSNYTFKYVDGRKIKIGERGYIYAYYIGNRKRLTPRKIFHKYFNNSDNGWINLSIISDFYSNYTCNPELGLIMNDITGQILKGCVNSEGYIRVDFCNRGKIKSHPIHRIVAFIKWGIPLDDLSIHVNHKNENKADNRACNLIVFTPKENATWSAINKTGYTNITQLASGKYYYSITKRGFKIEEEAYEWVCWAMPIANIENLKEGFREPINRDKEWMSLAIVGCPNYVINQKGKILNLTKCSIENHTEKDYINGYIKIDKTCKELKQYKGVNIINEKGQRKSFLIHILLAKCFIYNPDPEKYIKVDHDDNNGLNNNLENLSWTINRHNCTKDRKRKGKYPNVYKSKRGNFYVTFSSNLFNTPEEAQEDMKRVYKLLGLEYVDRNELRANEEIPE